MVRLGRGNEARLSKDSSEIRWICHIHRRFVGDSLEIGRIGRIEDWSNLSTDLSSYSPA